MIQWVIDVFGAGRISMLYADREFPPYQFLDFLINDNRHCHKYLELAFPEKFITAITPYQTGNLPFQIPADAINNIVTDNTDLAIVDTTTQLFLVQRLQTTKHTVYPLTFDNQYKKVRLQLHSRFANFKIGVAVLTTLFKGFTHNPTINFVARCKSSTLVSDGAKEITLAELYHDLHLKQSKTVITTTIRRAFGNQLYISARKNLKDEFVFIVSNIKLDDPFTIYKKRWNIELMFGKFKSLGFNLEASHIAKHSRLSVLMLIIGIAYTCSCKIGESYDSHIKPIKHKLLISCDGITKEERSHYSKFNVGFNLLKNFINNRLFAGETAAQFLHKILDYDPNNPPQLNKRSKLFKLIQIV